MKSVRKFQEVLASYLSLDILLLMIFSLSFFKYLITESEYVTGKSQTEALPY